MNQEKIKLLHEIHEQIIEKHRVANVPLIFQTMECANDEWYAKNLNTGKFSKLKFVPSDIGTDIVTLWSE